MPTPYYQCLSALIERIAPHPHGQLFSQHSIAKCWLSKVTLEPEQLNAFQTMPHYDSLAAHDMAAVHYLSGEHLGGTHFYRYKKANKLQFTKQDEALIMQMVQEVKQSAKERQGYMNESDNIFENVFSIEAKPNRIVIYSGNISHSANITDQVDFDKRAQHNRTSINSFFSLN